MRLLQSELGWTVLLSGLFLMLAGCTQGRSFGPSAAPLGWTEVAGACGSTRGEALCWQWDAAGEVLPASPVSLELKFRTAQGSFWEGCGLTHEGSAYCWGTAFAGFSPAPPSESCGAAPARPCALTPTSILPGSRFSQVSVGEGYACGILVDGRVACWGAADGREQSPARCPAGASSECGRLTTFPGPFSRVAAGGGHACALDAAGAAYCWGTGAYGELGSEGTEMCPREATTIRCSTNPLPVTGAHRFVDVTAGADHSCGIDRQGVAFCWGANSSGQLGTTQPLDTCVFGHIGLPCTFRPVRVDGTARFRQISAHASHTCAVSTDRAGYCWGEGGNGQLGQGIIERVHPYGERRTPVRVLGQQEFSMIDAAGVCGVTTSSELFCWGIHSPSRDIAAPFRMPDPPGPSALESFRLTELPPRPSPQATINYAPGTIVVEGTVPQRCAGHSFLPAFVRNGAELKLWLIGRRWEGGGCEETEALTAYHARISGLDPGPYELSLIYHYADDADRERPGGLGPIDIRVPQ